MAGGGFEVLAPCVSDAEGLARVHVQAWREAYGDYLPERFYDDPARRRRQETWASRLSAPDAEEGVRVARQGGDLVGFAVRGPAIEHESHPPVREEQLVGLYVLARCHGTGVGHALLEECLGGRPAQLWVARRNARARRFYEKHGVKAARSGRKRVAFRSGQGHPRPHACSWTDRTPAAALRAGAPPGHPGRPRPDRRAAHRTRGRARR